MDYLLLVGGLILLAVGGDVLVRGASGAASRLGVSPLLIGLVLVGFGTSMPELTTSVQAALAGSPGIAAGNVVGSNIANILLILGVAALIRSIPVSASALRRDGGFLAASQILAAVLILMTPVGRMSGCILVAAVLVYVGLSYWLDRRRTSAAAKLHAAEAESVPDVPGGLVAALLLFGLGLAGIIFGARLLVDGAVSIARDLGVSETVIGLSIVAVGTSLPELAASVSAALKRQGDIALGNIIGSNIFNVTAILGVTALVRPVAVPDMILQVDLWVMLGAAAALLAFAWTGRRIQRWEGGVLLAFYLAYTAWLATSAL
ncbi:calcium/sodium antiporter [Hyphobacterium marinum]|uniref:Calcium/sodium antiporter n=1 Tax=Hyphobacterium marinum TaxID=3116574 RepID=A0ABU7LXS6_9PROT|nr:calcium/sodium antiporter [Hyphobacterium sp. Y6023]MEE2566087.1 calcium/sodium antiporter [Hyphobacterium sp. Y6023]